MKNATARIQSASVEPGRKPPSGPGLPRPLTLSEAHALWTQKGGAPLRSARADPLEQSSPPRPRAERATPDGTWVDVETPADGKPPTFNKDHSAGRIQEILNGLESALAESKR